MCQRVHTAEEAAVILRCKVRWLKEQARKRKIPFVMTGGAYKFTDAHLDEILKIFEQPARPQVPRRAAARRAPQPAAAAEPVLRVLTPRGPRRKATGAAA